VLEVGILPSPHASAVTAGLADHRVNAAPASLSIDASPSAEVAGVPAPPPWSWRVWLLVAWVAGAVGFLSLAAARGLRFHRLLGKTEMAPSPLRRIAESLASRLGLRLCPRLRVVHAHISPMLWFPGGRLSLLFPQALLSRLSPRETDSLLTHELAHARRRDHWLRYLELLVLALFWWYPPVWWVRSRMRRAEEQCCDALVVRTMPENARDYAEALLKTIEFLGDSRAGIPLLASGAGPARKLEERLKMIMKNRTHKTMVSRPLRLALIALAVGVLSLFPTWSDGTPRAADDGEGRPSVANARVEEYRQQLLEIELATAKLEHALQQLQTRRIDVESELRELGVLEEIAAGRSHDAYSADKLRHEFDRVQAELLERQIVAEMKEAELQQRELDVDREMQREAQQLFEEAERLQRQAEAVMKAAQRLQRERGLAR